MNLISCSKQEKGVKEIVLKAMGQAISKTVAITEIIKVGLFLALFYTIT
jgi:DNA-binding protein